MNMLCEKCKKNEAQVHYTENINGKETSMSLCHECASKMKLGSGFGFGIPEFFGTGSLLGSILAPQKTGRSADSGKKCNLCGMSFADLMKEGKAGCPSCYDTFGDELERTIAGIHGGTRHTGKVPAKYQAKVEAQSRIKELREKIAAAIEKEDYEEAARLRDMIRDIENGEVETV